MKTDRSDDPIRPSPEPALRGVVHKVAEEVKTLYNNNNNNNYYYYYYIIYIYTHIHAYIYIYIYIHTHTYIT